MSSFVAEYLGTALFLFLGCGVCANNNLEKTGGHGGGVMMIFWGWAFAVMLPGVMLGQISGAHFNPAVTISFAILGRFAWDLVPGYLLAQLLGAMTGAVFAWLFYKPHFDITEDPALKKGVFCTAPTIRNIPFNCLSEFIGAFILMLCVLCLPNTPVGDSVVLGNLNIGILIFAIGASLGGTTGYAINPARDLGPRIVHALLPIKNKADSDWGYALVPILAPTGGAAAAAFFYQWIF